MHVSAAHGAVYLTRSVGLSLRREPLYARTRYGDHLESKVLNNFEL